MINKLQENILNILLPPHCCGCGKIGTLLCPECYEEIQFFVAPIHLKLPTLYLDEIVVTAKYQPPITSLIHSLKYQSVKNIGPLLGKLLHHAVAFPKTDLITAVPLHSKRHNNRGFNQAELIAKEISIALSIQNSTPYVPLLQRTRHTTAQASIADRTQRLTHLNDIFAFNSQHSSLISSRQSILLIDDVVTTGTTLNECARVLKNAGFEKVYGLALAHGK